MNKSLLILLIGLLIVGLYAQVDVAQYQEQGKLVLETDILNLGYSPNQRNLVVLTNAAQGKFYVYNGIRPNTPQIVNIVDGDLQVSPSAFAFASDNSMLIIGSKVGSIYGFVIQNGQVQPDYKYKYNIQTGGQPQVFSISISKGKKIAVGTNSQLAVFQIPTDESNLFKLITQYPYQMEVSSVAWKNDDQNSILVGCLGTDGKLQIFDVAKNQSINVNLDSTSSIGVLKDGRVIQGKVLKDIEILNWNEADTKYQSLGTIVNTKNATQIIIDTSNQYFGAQITTQNKVLAWKIDPLIEKNLKNSQILTLPTQVLNQTGTNLALSGNGNQILIVTDASSTVTRFNLCKDGFYYDGANCMACANDCDACFDANVCISCSTEFYITADDKCASCHDITPGCKTCSDQKTCTLCDSNLHRKSIVEGGVCVCDEVTYELENECKLCSESIDFCQSCSDATHCITCNPQGNINPIAIDDKCQCLQGWYLEEKVCKDCPTAITGCKYCDDSQTCTQCNAQNKFQQDGKGGCQCMEGNWFNPTTLSCQQCQTSVPGCLSCSQTGQCIICSEERRIPSQDKKSCICEPYTFENPQNICQLCDPYQQCLQCKPQSPNACTKCDTSKGRAQDPVNGICQCNKGFIENDDTHDCIACNVPGCEQCDKAQTCETCFAQKHFKQTPENGACVCEANYHLVENKTQCWTCDQNLTACKDCDNLKQCKQCDESANFQLNQETKLCQCKSSFFEENKECKLCSENFDYCQTCNKDNCQSCQSGFSSFNEQKKECYCPDDRDLDETAGTCEEKAGLSALAIIAIIVGILALAGGAVALIKCFKKRQSPLEDGEYEALEGRDK